MKTLLLISFFLIGQVCYAQAPGLVLPCEIIEVYDGDTVTVRFTMDIRVRLLDCWAPEIKTKNKDEKAYGQYSKRTLQKLIQNERTWLLIDLDGVDRLDDVISLGRILGRIWLIDSGMDVSEEMVRMGAANDTKIKFVPKDE